MNFIHLATSNKKRESGYQVYKKCLIWKGIPDQEKQLTDEEAQKLIKSTGAWMLRNIYDWDIPEESNFWILIKDQDTSFEYSKKTRKYIEKANNRFKYEIISRQRLKEEGYRIEAAAFRNYKVNDGFISNETEFQDKISKLDESIDIWGAIDKETNKLEAFSLCNRIGDTVDFQASKANPEFLPKYYVMYGLYDARNKYYLDEKKFRYVVTSARSITNHSNIQSFMIEKFGFKKINCRMHLHYVRWFKVLIRMLYPFRSKIKMRPLQNILRFEEINRDLKKNG